MSMTKEYALASSFERGLGSVVLRHYVREGRKVFKDGMSREEFKTAVLKESEGGAPQWLHDMIDWIWDCFS